MEETIKKKLIDTIEDIIVNLFRAPLGLIVHQLIAQDQYYINELDQHNSLKLVHDGGVISCFNRIRKHEGLTPFFRPFGLLLCERLWTKSVNYLFDDKPLFHKHEGDVTTKDIVYHTAKRFGKGVMDSLLCYPIEVLLIKYAAQYLPHQEGLKPKETNIMRIYSQIVSKDGLVGLYHGFSIQLITDLICAWLSVQLEWLEHKELPNKGKFHPKIILTFLLALILLFPIDMVTIRMQLQAGEKNKKLFGEIAKDIFKNESIFGFYRFAILRFLNFGIQSYEIQICIYQYPSIYKKIKSLQINNQIFQCNSFDLRNLLFTSQSLGKHRNYMSKQDEDQNPNLDTNMSCASLCLPKKFSQVHSILLHDQNNSRF